MLTTADAGSCGRSGARRRHCEQCQIASCNGDSNGNKTKKAGADDGMNEAIMQNADARATAPIMQNTDGEDHLYEIIPQNADALLMAVSDRRGVRDK